VNGIFVLAELGEAMIQEKDMRIVEQRELDACRGQPLLQPVVARIDGLDLRGAELREYAGDLAGRGEFAALDIPHLPHLPTQPIRIVLQRRVMQKHLFGDLRLRYHNVFARRGKQRDLPTIAKTIRGNPHDDSPPDDHAAGRRTVCG
jgi:hypothetical protein